MVVSTNRNENLAWCLGALLAVQVLVTATTMSVTCDESGHIGGGLHIWDNGKFDVYLVGNTADFGVADALAYAQAYALPPCPAAGPSFLVLGEQSSLSALKRCRLRLSSNRSR